MNEGLISILVIFAELGLLLIILAAIYIFLKVKSRKLDRMLVVNLVKRLKDNEPVRREHLVELLKLDYEMDENNAKEKADNLIGCEKVIYNRVIKLFLGKDKHKLSQLDNDVNNLANGYCLLGKQKAAPAETDRDNELLLRKENQELRKHRAKLEADLEASITTMEAMMAEYANMYEGGAKEGEQRLKNEMFQLRKVLENRNAGIDKLSEENLAEIPLSETDENNKN